MRARAGPKPGRCAVRRARDPAEDGRLLTGAGGATSTTIARPAPLRRLPPRAVSPRARREDRRRRRARAAGRGGGVDGRGDGARLQARAALETPAVKVTLHRFPRSPWAGSDTGRGGRDGRAESRYLAEDAVERILVEYEPLPVVDMEAALAPSTPAAPRGSGRRTSASRASSRAATSTRRSPAPTGRPRALPLPPARRGLHGESRLPGRVRPATGLRRCARPAQCPGLVREAWPMCSTCRPTGSASSRRTWAAASASRASLYPEEIAVCVMARGLGRPVKWIGDRREDLLATTPGLGRDRRRRARARRRRTMLGVARRGRRPTSAPTRSIRGRRASSRCRS